MLLLKRISRFLVIVSLLFTLIPLSFGQEEELKIKLPPAVIIGEERMTIADPRVPPVPGEIALGVKEEPTVDTSQLRERIIGEVHKTSPVVKSPGCAYSSGVSTSVAALFKGAEAKYKRAKYHYYQGNYDRAWLTFESLLKKYPESPYTPSATYWMGETRWHQGRQEEALVQYRRVVENFPASEFVDYALYSAGWISLKSDNPAQAHELLSLLRREDSASPVAPLAVFWDGYALMEMGQCDQAVPLYDEILSVHSSHPQGVEALYLKGVCLFLLGNYESSLAVMTRFIAGHPSHQLGPGALYIKSWSLVYMERYKEAIASFDEYLRRFPGGEWQDVVRWGQVRSWLGLGNLQAALHQYEILTARQQSSPWEDNILYEIALYHFNGGDYDKAIVAYQAFLRRYPRSELTGAVHIRSGESFYKTRQYAEAARAWERFLVEVSDHPQKAEVLYWLGEAYLLLGDYERGREYLLQTKSDSDIYVRSLLALGWYHFDQGQWEEAVKSFQDLLAVNPVGPTAQRAMLLMGESLFNQKNYDLALDVFSELEMQGGMPPALNERLIFYQGLVKYKQGTFSAATGRFRYLLEAYPQQSLRSETFFWLGWAYFRQNDFKEAITTFSRLVEESPLSPLAPKALMKIGDSYYNLNDSMRAVMAYLRVTREYPEAPEVPEAEWGVILSFYQEGKYDNFSEWVEAFLEKHPNHPTGANVLLLLGDFYRRRSNLALAIETYRRIRFTFPSLPLADEARLREATLLVRAERLKEAKAVLYGVTRRPDSPYYPQAIFLLGEIYYGQKQFAAAARYYEELMRMEDEAIAERSWLRAGEAYKAMGNSTRALQVLRAFVSRHPQAELTGDAWLMIGNLFSGSALYHEAIAAYRKGVVTGRRGIKAAAQLGIARSHQKLKDEGTALTEFMKVYYLYPDQKATVVQALLEAGDIYL